MVSASDSEARGRGFDPHSGRHVLSMSKTHLLSKKYWLFLGSGGSIPTWLKNCLLWWLNNNEINLLKLNQTRLKWTCAPSSGIFGCKANLYTQYLFSYEIYICMNIQFHLRQGLTVSISLISQKQIESNYEMSRDVRKWIFAYAKTKTQISFEVTAKLISAFVFASWIVHVPLLSKSPKFQASNHLLWLHSPVCVGPTRKSAKNGFLITQGSNDTYHQKLN